MDRRAKFWRGETAEKLVAARTADAAREKAERLAARKRPAGKRAASSGEPRGAKTPEQTLARLKRALPRRKTLAAKQRVAERIRALEATLAEAR